MRLYYAPGACSLAPHIVLREAERRFDLERVDLAAQRTASGQDFRRINPKGTVPVLQLDGPSSEVLTQCPAILQYLADLAPEKQLAPPNGTFARYHLQEWLDFISNELHAPLAMVQARDTPPAYAQRLRGQLAERFTYMQEILSHHGMLMGETFTVADAYLFATLQWCRHDTGFDLQLWPNLDDYEYTVAERPAVHAALAAEGLTDRHHWKRTG